MRSVCCVGQSAPALTHTDVRSRLVLLAALHPDHLTPT